MTIWTVVLACLIVSLASCGQTISGFGFTLVSVPLLATVMPSLQAVSVAMIVSTPLTYIRVRRERADVDWAIAKRLGYASLAGLPIGIVLAGHLPDRPMRLFIGVVVALAGLLMVSGFTLGAGTVLSDCVCGFLSGVLSTTTGTNGPPLVVALHGRHMRPAAFRATLVAIYVLANVVTLLMFWRAGRITRPALQISAFAFFPMLGGNEIGARLAPLVPDKTFRRLILALLFVSAATAIITALR